MLYFKQSSLKASLFLPLLFFFIQLSAQTKSTDFEMKVPSLKIHNSSYNKFVFLDSRADTLFMGVVHTGLLNQKVKVTAKPILKEQINKLFSTLIDPSALSGTLLLQLRQFSFSEAIRNTKETGYCYVRANLYRLNGTQYQQLDDLDTLISFSALDVTPRLFKEGSEVVTKFIASNLRTVPISSTTISYDDIEHIDSVEKSKLKLYTSLEYKNGLYRNYTSFKNQTPDYTHVSCELKNGIFNIVKIEDDQGKKVTTKDAYAVVYEGKPYILTDDGNYPLRKERDTLCFIGLTNSGQITGKQIAATALFGVVGYLAVSDHSTGYADIRLDHLSGEFIPFRKLDRKEVKQKMKTGEIPRRVFNEDSYNDGY